MLINTFPEYSGVLEGTLIRRVKYLTRRARSLPNRSSGSQTLGWQPLVIEATLWLEASEGLVALGEYAEARGSLFLGARALLQAGLPLGAALQRILMPADNDLTPLSDLVMKVWRNGFVGALRSEAVPDQDQFPLIEVAQDTSQQRAYFDLAESLPSASRRFSDSRSEDLDLGSGTAASAAVGRLGLPLRDYLLVVGEGGDAARDLRVDDEQSRERAVNHILERSVRKLYRILEESSKNHYLWARMLVPIPIFDFDTAMLVAIAKTARAAKGSTDIKKALTGSTPNESAYVSEFMAAVDGLRAGDDNRSAAA